MDKKLITYIGAQLRHRLDPVTREPLLPKFEAVVADAARFAALRLIVCETDKAKQERMLAVFDSIDPPDQVTPEQFDQLFDAVLVKIHEARNAE